MTITGCNVEVWKPVGGHEMNFGDEAIQLLREVTRDTPDMWVGIEVGDECQCWRHRIIRLLAKIDAPKPSQLDEMI